MEQRGAETDHFNLREWDVKARMVSRENTRSRRLSAPNISSFRELDTTTRSSFRSNITISSTASSPGYTLKEEINPSTYSFTTALKALQARSAGYSWECSSPDGFALNSKWSEAEKYISNPLSGEVPMECLSAKTLTGQTFRNLAACRNTMSAPIVYNNSHSSRPVHPKPSFTALHQNEVQLPIPETKAGSRTRDVGTQSTPPELITSSSSSLTSPANSTPPIKERSIKRGQLEIEDSPDSNIDAKLTFEEKVEMKGTSEKGETKKKEHEQEAQRKIIKAIKHIWKCRQGGCLSLKSLWMRKRQREKHKPRKNNNRSTIFINHINMC